MEKTKLQGIYRTIMVIIVTAIITFVLTATFMYKKYISVYALAGGTTDQNKLVAVLQEFKTILQQKYIGDIDENKMAEGAIKGYIDGLGDQYTTYLTADEMKALTEETSGKYVGIGVYVANNTENNTILVIGVMKNSPALEAGMQAGDIIEKIDGTAYAGKQLTEATTILKGTEGTKVKITIVRDGKEIEMEVTRKTITVEHVASKMMDNNIGYIQIDSFDDGVAKAFESQLKDLQSKNIKGLIIDLRSNGGGVVSEATDIADLFTKKGDTLLITKAKDTDEKLTKAERDPIIQDIPVIVLENESTASASEILAGALRDNYGAKIVGENSYGKGVIQTVYKLTDGSGLKITTDEYFTPKHNQINKRGIKPDIEVDLTKDADGNYQTSEDKDAQLLKAIDLLKQ